MKRAVVLQSGGVTAVINASLAGVISECKKKKIEILGSRFGILGVLKNDFLNLTKFSSSELQTLYNTPAAALGSCRHKLNTSEIQQALKTLKNKKIDFLFPIGGNDSAEAGLHLSRESQKALQAIAIPKTIDNDLFGMDHTPGYASIARFMALTTQEAALDTKAMRFSDPIKIVETMGRNSGWIVASAALARQNKNDAPHLLYFPERAFDEKQFIEDVKNVYKKIGWCVVVVSETIRDKNGNRVGREKEHVKQDAFGHKYVEGTAQYLAGLIEQHLKVRARFDKPGTIARMAMGYVSKVDQKEAFECGRTAVKLAVQGKSERMVTIERVSTKPYRVRFGSVALASIIGHEKPLPKHFIHANGHDITPAFSTWLKPLVHLADTSTPSLI